MIRLLHLADVHLGAPLSSFGDYGEARRQELLGAFESLPRAAADADVHAVAIAGDLFDGPRPGDDVIALARETIRRLVQDGHPVFLVPGNHDALTLSTSPYRERFGGAHLFTSPRFGTPVTIETPEGLLNVYGIAYDRAAEPFPLSSFRRADRPGVHVVLLHGAVPDSPHWGPSPNALQLPLDQLAGLQVDYIALGDYHRFRPPAGFSRPGVGSATPPACYSGSLIGLDRSEDGPRGWVLAELEPGQPPRVRQVDGGARPIMSVGDVDVTTFADEIEIATSLGDRLPAASLPHLRLTGSPAFPLDARRVAAELVARFGHAWIEDRTSHYASARLDELAAEDTVSGHLVRVARARITAAGEAGDAAGLATAEHALRLALAALGTR